MMMNLFSIFDPSTFLFSMNWVSSLLILMMLYKSNWMFKLPQNNFLSMIKSTLSNEFYVILLKNKMNIILFLTLFLFILFNNFLGLFSYIFTSSSHLVFTMSLAFPIWLGFLFYYWLNFTKMSLAHFVPLGTPLFLMPFMVLIEITSMIIRPITLSIRLAANMIAGHLLIVLLSSLAPNKFLILSMLIIFIQIFLLILEMAVAMIQAYVFSILSTLYSSEA